MPLLIIDALGMRKLPLTAAETILELIMRRYERASTVKRFEGRAYRSFSDSTWTA